MSGSVQRDMGEQRDTDGRTRDAESGRYVEGYSHDEVYEVVVDLGDATTRDVEERLGCAYQTAYKKLRELEDDGRIRGRLIGNVRLWIPIEDSDE